MNRRGELTTKTILLIGLTIIITCASIFYMAYYSWQVRVKESVAYCSGLCANKFNKSYSIDYSMPGQVNCYCQDDPMITGYLDEDVLNKGVAND